MEKEKKYYIESEVIYTWSGEVFEGELDDIEDITICNGTPDFEVTKKKEIKEQQ